jgi:hypothetical protein
MFFNLMEKLILYPIAERRPQKETDFGICIDCPTTSGSNHYCLAKVLLGKQHWNRTSAVSLPLCHLPFSILTG